VSALLDREKESEVKWRAPKKERDELLLLVDELKLYIQQQNDVNAKLQHATQQQNALAIRQLQETNASKETTSG
jgi:hypothetical protein